MGVFIGTVRHPAMRSKPVKIYEGFSWPAFLISPLWLFYKGLVKQGVYALLLSFFPPLIGQIYVAFYCGFKGNGLYIKHLLAKGYTPDDEFKSYLVQKGYLGA